MRDIKKKMLQLSDPTQSFKDNLKTLEIDRHEVVALFEDPDIQTQWIEMCRSEILMTMLPELLAKFVKEIKGCTARELPSLMKLYLQTVRMLKEDSEEHKHLHMGNMTDAQLLMELEKSNELMSEMRENGSRKQGEGTAAPPDAATGDGETETL